MSHAEEPVSPAILGEIVQEFVNRVSHAQGKTLAALSDAGVTLPQVLLLRRVASNGETTTSELAGQMHMSLPAVSQMAERLSQLSLLSRIEATDDRRKKRLMVTQDGRKLLTRISKARSADYAAGVAPLSARVRAGLLRVLSEALEEL